jgi:protein-disulfide isomerase
MADRSKLARWQSIAETTALMVVAAAVAWMAIARATPGTRPMPSDPPPRRAEPPVPSEPIPLAGAQLQGDTSAPIGLVIYSDFECPFCARFAREALPRIQEKYVKTGRVLLAFRQYPLPIHAHAEKAAEAAVCAGRQARFWPYHDLLFASQPALDEASLVERATSLGFDTGAFTTCLQGEAAAAVRADYAGGGPLGVSGTPTFLAGPIVGGHRLHVSQRFSGALPLAQFEAILDQLLAAAATANPATR